MQLETSGKRIEDKVYTYAYYNCRRTLRTGAESCSGRRVRTTVLDSAVLTRIADLVCTEERTAALAERIGWCGKLTELAASWRTLVMTDASVGREYVRHVVDRVIVGDEITLVSRSAAAKSSDDASELTA